METYWLKNKIILLGPYVGSIEEELLSFKPFVDWFTKNIYSSSIIISTHYNRRFLYDYPIIPIFKQYTNDEKNQYKHKHSSIKAKDYLFIEKYMKDQITDLSEYNKKDIITYNLGYSSIPNITQHQKLFKKINKTNNQKYDVTFIPHYSRPEKENLAIFKSFNNLNIIGDKKTNLKQFNKLLNYSTKYNQVVYESIINNILNSKMVITPCSWWTLFCKLHNIPVFSWGKNVSYYKDIVNDNCSIIPFNKGDDMNKIIKSIKTYKEKIC